MNDEILAILEKRMGRMHARQRLGIEKEKRNHAPCVPPWL